MPDCQMSELSVRVVQNAKKWDSYPATSFLEVFCLVMKENTKKVGKSYHLGVTIVQIFLYTGVKRQACNVDWPVLESMLITKIPGLSFMVYGTLNDDPVKKITLGLIGKNVNKCEGLRAVLLALLCVTVDLNFAVRWSAVTSSSGALNFWAKIV